MASFKILIVDDDRDLRMGLGARLRGNDFDVVFAEDGMGAIAVARREKPDLVLLDLGLPAGDGYVVLERLQANTALSTVPVIVLSARNADENEKRALASGAVAFFQKPVDNDALVETLRRTLGAGA